MGARRILGLTSFAVLLVLGAVGYLLFRDSERNPAHTGEAHDVALALRKLMSDPDALVATASRPLVGERARRALPAGAKVIPQERSWRADGYGGGVIRVRIARPGGPSVDYAAIMVRERLGWKILATVPIRRRATPPDGP